MRKKCLFSTMLMILVLTTLSNAISVNEKGEYIQLISPTDGSKVGDSYPVFKWYHIEEGSVTYTIKIWEHELWIDGWTLSEHYTGSTTFQGSLHSEVSYQYPYDAPALEEFRGYSWQVSAQQPSAGSSLWNFTYGPIFYVPFEGNVTPAVYGGPGNAADQVAWDETQHADVFVDGIKGQALKVDKETKSTVVKYKQRFPPQCNLYPPKGTIELWVRPQFDIENNLTHGANFFAQDYAWTGKHNSLRIAVFDGVLYTDVNWTGWFQNVRWWNKGEWHQIAFTWKPWNTTHAIANLYINGKFFSTFYVRVLGELDYFFIGRHLGHDPDQSFDIDELKIYNGVLSEKEIHNHYIKMFPIECYAKETVFYTKWLGQQVNVEITNIYSDIIKGHFDCKVRGGSGSSIWKELPSGQTITLTVPFGAEEPGEYYVDCTYEYSLGPNVRIIPPQPKMRTIRLFAISSLEQPMKPETEKLELDTGILINCSENKIYYGNSEENYGNSEETLKYFQTNWSYPYQAKHNWCYDYRRTGNRSGDRFGYQFEVKQENLGKPHLVVVDYPAIEDPNDSQPARTMEIDILEPGDWIHGPTIQTGVFTGGEYPFWEASHNLIKQHRIIFWPQTINNTITIVNRWEGHRAAAIRIWIFPIKGNETHGWFPKTNVVTPPDGGRLLGLWWEEPQIYKNFGAPNATIRGFYEALKNMIQYLHYTGQNLLVYPIYFYNDPIYPSRIEGWPVWGGKGMWHPDDWFELMLKMCQVNDVSVIASFTIGSIPSLEPDKYGQPAQGHEGTLIEDKVLAIFEEVHEEYGHYPALKGVSFNVWGHAHVYVINKRLMDLHGRHLDWVLWKYYPNGTVTGRGWSPEQKVIFSEWLPYPCYSSQLPQPQKYYKWCLDYWKDKNYQPAIITDMYDRAGVRLDNALRDNVNNPMLRIERVLDFPTYRQGGCKYPLQREFFTNPNYSQSCYGLFSKTDNTAAAIYNSYFEGGVQFPSCSCQTNNFDKGFDQELNGGFWRFAAITPGYKYFMEYYMLVMTNLDPIQIGNGGSSVGTVGHDVRLEDLSVLIDPLVLYGLPIQNFAKAFRALPTKSFKVIYNNKIQVRDLTLKEPSPTDSITNYYFYLMNKKSYNVTVTLTFNQPSFNLIDLVTGDVIPVANGQYIVELCPYELRSYRTEGTVKITGVTVQVVSPQHNVAVKYVTLPSREVYPGWNVTVKISNLGHYNETVDVKVYLNDTVIGAHATPIPPETDDELEFVIPFEPDIKLYVNYTLRVEVSPIYNETVLGDNIYIYGYILIKMTGDVNCDRKVNIMDIYAVAKAFGSTTGDPRYDVKADIDYNGAINIVDIYKTARNFGKTYTP